VTLLSGVMRWDIRHPEKRVGDPFVQVGGHTIPLIYTTLALFNEALRVKCAQTKDSATECRRLRSAPWCGRTCCAFIIAAGCRATPWDHLLGGGANAE